MAKTYTRLDLSFDDLETLRIIAKEKGKTPSEVAEDIILAYFTDNRLEIDFQRRLYIFDRRLMRVETTTNIVQEVLALFINFFLLSTPPLPEAMKTVAQMKATARYHDFLRTLSRRLHRGNTLVNDLQKMAATDEEKAGEQ